MIDEPLVRPFSPGAAIVRLTEIEGALERFPALAQALNSDWKESAEKAAADNLEDEPAPVLAASLQTARQDLLHSIKNSDFLQQQQFLHAAQDLLWRLYQLVNTPKRWSENPSLAQVLAALNFPDPQNRESSEVAAVDVRSVMATFSKPQRQVLTALSFQPAAGATFYRLQEIRVVQDEDCDDDLLENHAPLFRVRLPIGPHRLRIVALNLHKRHVSEEFTLEVPDL
jgi:hypothetical protein